jgi:hypothetical protein
MVTKRFRAGAFELIDDHSGNRDGNLALARRHPGHCPAMVKTALTARHQAASG